MVHSLIYCNQFSCLFWWDVDSDAFPVIRVPMFFAEFPQWKHCGSFLKNHKLFDFAVAFLFVRTSPLAVITVGGLLDVLMVSNSAELKAFSLTICILAPESTTNSLFLHLLFCWRIRECPFLRGKEECSPVFFFELVYVFGKVPCLVLGTSLLSFSLFVGPILEFHSVGTSLMSRFDLYFSKRWSLLVELFELRSRLSASGFPGTVCLFEKPTHPSLARRNPRYNCRNSHNILVVAFSSFLGIVAFLWLYVWFFINLVMPE